MIIRSKAPLRLGFAGGGTDIASYSSKYGGCVLNATIDMYAYCTIKPEDNGFIEIQALDIDQNMKTQSAMQLEIRDDLILHRGVYNRLIKEFKLEPLSFSMATYSDSPAGSGLGTSSTMVVAILQAFVEWLKLPLSEYDVANLACDIERNDLKLAGGKQDQYAATFGGFNFIEFKQSGDVIVNPLRIKDWILNEFEGSIVMYFTGKSRSSANIINDQVKNFETNNEAAIEAMHKVKKEAYVMKEALLKGNFNRLFECLRIGWEQKKKTSSVISNAMIEHVLEVGMANGAVSAKVSGAGGGGFIMFFCNPLNRISLINALDKLDGTVSNIKFSSRGAEGWTIR